MRSGSGVVIDDPPDFSETDPIQAVRRIFELTGITTAKDVVSRLLCALADDLGTMETIMETRKFLHFERTRMNRVIPPPEGWETVRNALVDFHGTLRAAFVNMCAGRRGGVMSAAELHRGMITIEMPHVTEKVLNAICPEQIIPPDEIFIDFEEFMWIMNGCGDQGVAPNPNRPMRDAASTAEIKERVDVVVEVGSSTQDVRVKELEKSHDKQTKTITSLEARLAQLEASTTSSQANSPKHPSTPASPTTPRSRRIPPPHESTKSPQNDPHKKTTPQLASVWGDTDFSSIARVEDSSPEPPRSPTYYKSPTMRPRTPSRRGSITSMSGSVRYTSPPKTLPPGLRLDNEDASYPAKVPAGSGIRRSTSPGVVGIRPPSPPTVKRSVSPTVVAPNPSFVRPPSPTASVRSVGWGSPHSLARGPSFSGSIVSDGGSVRRISSSIKSPVKPQGSSSRRPGMVSPPQSRPTGSYPAPPSAFDLESHHSSTYPYQDAVV
eukprot:TRINITY_DN7756_c2_g4_i1.p1 TRINITY_DN7756_c2_g4~~TRINITY_DN7756_c2_g4_i1.p1  ORF type:complete len:493 (+),score=82.79 TRINITY_DN7756_c2_g4_i1:236-1714(+)